MRIAVLSMFFLLIVNSILAQTEVYPNYYAVYFTDKNNCGYDINNPEKFLSSKAIERRKKFNIPITEQDLPVTQKYVDSLKSMGLKVIEVSRWLNCAIVVDTDSTNLAKIKALSFVRPKPKPLQKNYTYKKLKRKRVKIKKTLKDKYNYGQAENQVKMLDVNQLHDLGFDGKGITIAIFDAGFWNVDKISFFDSLWANHRILGWYDFVDQDTTLFDTGEHGTMVLSTIAAYKNGEFVGTAPQASFYLFRTENEHSEYPIEEYNYVCAAEKADSLGVDVIHSSLGYTHFDNNKMSYSYKDLNGNTGISTIGADIAASKGIIVTVSAGNEGDNKWRYISVPADGDSVLSVGAVDANGRYAYFSSAGPTYDGRIKPDVMAEGLGVSVVGRDDYVKFSAGTSFSGPIIAGCMACLRQAFPDNTNIELMNAVRQTASNAKKPNNFYGYGIPDFYKAYLLLMKQNSKK